MAISLSSCLDLARSRQFASDSASFSPASDSFCNDVNAKEYVGLRMPDATAVCEVELHNRQINPLYCKEDVQSLCAKVCDNARYAWQGVRNRMLIVLGICTGLRVSDLVRLRLGDIVCTDGTFRLGLDTVMKKTHGVVHVNFNKVCYQAVLDWLRSIGKNPEHLCVSDLDMWLANKDKAGTVAVAEDRLYRVIKRAAADAGIPYNVGSHTMRKTFSRIWYENNKSNPNAIYVLQKMLGHKSIESTLHYICVAKEESRKFAGTMEEVFATATATTDDTIATYDTTNASTATNASAVTNDAVTTYDTNSVVTDSCENDDTDTANVEEDSYTGNAQDLRYHDTYEKQYTSLFPVGHAPTNFATPTKVGMSHQARSSHKHITNTNTKLPNYIKLTRNNNVSPFPCGYNDHKLIVGHNSMATSKLG